MNLFDVYPLYDVSPVKANDVFITDNKGNKYLDFYGGHGVVSIGHSNPHYVSKLKEQLDAIGFYSNAVQNPLQIELAKKLGELSGYKEYNLFLCNSGAEANENALKLASFYNGKKRVITFDNSFHGRTSLAVSVTDNQKINAPINSTNPNLGAGAFYYTENFYVGLSFPNMLEVSHLKTQNGKISNVSEKMHYFVTSGYVFDLTGNLKFKPSTMIKAVSGAPLSIDVSANFLFNEKVEIGASYRLDDSVSGLVTFQIARGFRMGYAYDYTISNLGDYNDGSHEAFLLWDIFSTEKNIKSPRFF